MPNDRGTTVGGSDSDHLIYTVASLCIRLWEKTRGAQFKSLHTLRLCPRNSQVRAIPKDMKKDLIGLPKEIDQAAICRDSMWESLGRRDRTAPDGCPEKSKYQNSQQHLGLFCLGPLQPTNLDATA